MPCGGFAHCGDGFAALEGDDRTKPYRDSEKGGRMAELIAQSGG